LVENTDASPLEDRESLLQLEAIKRLREQEGLR
jgi:hypothetical protein